MVDFRSISPILTTEYLNQQISLFVGADSKYNGHELLGDVDKGNSSISDVYKIRFYCRLKDAHPGESSFCLRIIFKCLPKSIVRRKTCRSTDFFRNEVMFYTKVLPKLLEFQETKNVSNPFDCYAKVFAASTDGHHDFVALEDISTDGFAVAAWHEGIDLPHSKIILEQFAKFHALSFAFKSEYPLEFKNIADHLIETCYDTDTWEWYRGYWKSLCVAAIDAVEKEYPESKYEEKIKEFASDTSFLRMIRAATERGSTSVINHGGSRTPNFFFKYKCHAKIPLEIKMIDFQQTRCSSPVIDIAIFTYACTTELFRKEHFDEILIHYHEILSKQLKELGSDAEQVYPWSVFMKEVKKYFFFGLGYSFESIPSMILDSDAAFDVNASTGTEAVKIEEVRKVSPIKSKAGRLREAGNIVHAVDNGYI